MVPAQILEINRLEFLLNLYFQSDYVTAPNRQCNKQNMLSKQSVLGHVFTKLQQTSAPFVWSRVALP